MKASTFSYNQIAQNTTQHTIIPPTQTNISFAKYVECHLKEAQAKLSMYLPDSPNYNRLMGRIEAYKEMKVAHQDLYHDLPDSLLKEVSEWVMNAEKDMETYGCNSFPYFYAKGGRNAIVDVFDILKQYGYESNGSIPEM